MASEQPVHIAALSIVVFFSVELVGRETWFTDELAALIHSVSCMVLTGATVVLDLSTGRDIYCFCSCPIEPPWTASVLPAITMGYGVYDLVVGIRRHARMDYSLHGIVLILACGAVCMTGQAHTVTYMMLMEWSTVFLNLRRLKSVFIDAAFAFLFLLIRLVIVPVIWTTWVYRFYRGSTDTSCIPLVVPWAALFGGIIVNSLNVYWGRLLIVKVREKIRRFSKSSSEKVEKVA
jgi:hypothetical protein